MEINLVDKTRKLPYVKQTLVSIFLVSVNIRSDQ